MIISLMNHVQYDRDICMIKALLYLFVNKYNDCGHKVSFVIENMSYSQKML